MIENGIRRFRITSDVWGDVEFLRPIPNPDPWGILRCLRGSPWGDLIPIVSGDAMSHALHGRTTPLMREAGRDPRAQLMMIPKESRPCHQFKGCIMADASTCWPCAKVPQCYEAPHKTPEIRRSAALVVHAWAEGRYVVVVEGPEFTL